MMAKIVNSRDGGDGFEAEVRRTLKKLLPRKRRAEIAEALSAAMGRTITKSMLDNFVAAGKYQPRLPLSVAKALCEVLETPSLRRYLNSEEDLALIEIGEHARANTQLIGRLGAPKQIVVHRAKW